MSKSTEPIVEDGTLPTDESVTVKIPRSQVFTHDALSAMMTRIGNGGFP